MLEIMLGCTACLARGLFRLASGARVCTGSLGELSDPMQLLACLCLGARGLTGITGFVEMRGRQKIKRRLHEVGTRVSLTERLGFSQDGFGGLSPLELAFSLPIVFLCERIGER